MLQQIVVVKFNRVAMHLSHQILKVSGNQIDGPVRRSPVNEVGRAKGTASSTALCADIRSWRKSKGSRPSRSVRGASDRGRECVVIGEGWCGNHSQRGLMASTRDKVTTAGTIA